MQKKQKRETVGDPKKEVCPGCSINIKEVNVVAWCEPGREVGRKTRGGRHNYILNGLLILCGWEEQGHGVKTSLVLQLSEQSGMESAEVGVILETSVSW